MANAIWSVLAPVLASGVDRWSVLVALLVAAMHGVACASVLRRLDLRERRRSSRGDPRHANAGPPGFTRSAADGEPPMR